ncbi:CMRF35-like molecule 9 isoform X3 [Nannospalax galili]|uniref:CMRF35-like molecule 9 isoform X3 n=1 Tax=Nannospalax galili TaxID=1026970 RepID=UPI0004ED20A6|nr:CMRF35-like molecule 9 isoform X3 [Nannospalax galili]
MRLLILLWGYLVLPGHKALKGPKEISGFEGDTVTLQCTYEKTLKEHRKYWCQQGGILVSRCSGIIYTREDQEVTEGRVSIRDSPQDLLVTVTMRGLTLKDAGKYWCGVDRVGFDEAFEVSLIVFPGKGDSPSTTGASPFPSFQFLIATTYLQPSAKAWQTQPPELRSSRPIIWLPPISPKGSSDVTGSSVSNPSVSIPMVRMLAPVLVLLSLLLAAGLIAFSSHMLRWRNKAWLATETQRNEKIYLPTSKLGNGWVSEDARINLVASPGPLGSPKLSAGPFAEIQYRSQTTEEEAAPSQDSEDDMVATPPLMSSEELGFSEFISV